MRTPPARLCIPVLALLIGAAACSGDDPTVGTAGPSTIGSLDQGATVDSAATAASTTSGPATDDSVDLPAVPTGTGDLPVLPTGTADVPLPPVDTTDLPHPITVTVGVDSGPERIEQVSLGTTVALSIINLDDADEYHLHGYELGDGQEVAAGEAATFTFVADQAGRFELESHTTNAVLLVLEVV